MDTFIRALRKIPSLALIAAMSSNCIASGDGMELMKEEQIAETESAVLLATGECLKIVPDDQNEGHARIPVNPAQMPQTGMTVSLWFNTAIGQWHHVAHTLGAGGSKLYVDGELVASNSAVTASTFTNEGFIALGTARCMATRPMCPRARRSTTSRSSSTASTISWT